MFLFIFRTLATCDATAITTTTTTVISTILLLVCYLYSLAIIVMWCYSRTRILLLLLLLCFILPQGAFFPFRRIRKMPWKKKSFLPPVQAMAELVYEGKEIFSSSCRKNGSFAHVHFVA